MPKERFKIIPVSLLILIKDGNILLSRRFNTGYEDGNYGVVSGHLDGNETFMEAMAREAKEEAGIDIAAKDLEVAHVMHRKSPPDERIDFYIRANNWQGELRIMEPNKCDDLKWFSIDNLPANTIPYIRQAIEKIRKKIFYSEFGW
ncbi:NUDIX domain-containing protein [Patescibacteria group bacterium]|nr:NUDIX domain-containing protein [Patescibacteria group bacterium]MBU4579895.1 NUDIX domain-containing protein [Patescibacteria group bacterium]